MKNILKFIKDNPVKTLYVLSVISLIGWGYGLIHPLVLVGVLSTAVLVDCFKIGR